MVSGALPARPAGAAAQVIIGSVSVLLSSDLESASVGHLDILAQNNICFRIVKCFDF